MLYLVRADDDPPIPTGCLEDWVRIPGDDRDLHARLAALELRAALHQAPPFVDDDDRLHYRGRIIPLTSNEARLAAVLAARFGAVVPDERSPRRRERSGGDADELVAGRDRPAPRPHP